MAALGKPGQTKSIYEIGGDEIFTYGDLMLEYARLPRLKAQTADAAGHPAVVHGNRRGNDDTGSLSNRLRAHRRTLRQ